MTSLSFASVCVCACIYHRLLILDDSDFRCLFWWLFSRWNPIRSGAFSPVLFWISAMTLQLMPWSMLALFRCGLGNGVLEVQNVHLISDGQFLISWILYFSPLRIVIRPKKPLQRNEQKKSQIELDIRMFNFDVCSNLPHKNAHHPGVSPKKATTQLGLQMSQQLRPRPSYQPPVGRWPHRVFGKILALPNQAAKSLEFPPIWYGSSCLNQPLWKKCSPKWDSSSPIFGVKLPKIVEITT